MENFSFSAILKKSAKKHKMKPKQFSSVIEGTKKRLETNISNRRSNRLTFFDLYRNLPKCETPKPEPLTKEQQRRLQLLQWKAEKAKKKAEILALKKKPFLVGKPKNPLQFEPLPPIKMPVPSTSGRVTRSQASRCNNVKQTVPGNKQTLNTHSFAPKNAGFNPVLKDLDTLPTLFRGLKSGEKILRPIVEHRSLRSRNKLPEVQPSQSNTSTTTSNDVYIGTGARPKTKSLNKITHNTKTAKSSHILSNTDSSSSSFETKTAKLSKTKSPKKFSRSTRNARKHDLKTVSNSSSSNEAKTLEKLPIIEGTPIGDQQDLNVTPNIPDPITFTPKKPVPKSESSSEEKLRLNKSDEVENTDVDIENESQNISPRVCLSRGKENMRKEMKKRMLDGQFDDDVCDMEAIHFRRQLESEIARITKMCDEWDTISEQVPLPENVEEAVRVAVGQARLLMSQKFQQFASLVRRCEQPEHGQALVTTGDLQGFWDMVFIQVENVDIRFKKLEQCRARGWAEEQPRAQQRKPAPRAPAARPAHPAASSRLKELIAAARKANSKQPEAVPPASPSASPKPATKTFDAGFFSVQSPVRSPAPRTPNRPSLLKVVLSNEAAKKSSYAILRASLLSKNIENEESMAENPPLTSINFSATPGKSILKSNKDSTKKTDKKSIKVLFDNTSVISSSDTNEPEVEISGVEELPNASEDESQATENGEEKENGQSRSTLKLVRQNAFEENTPATRSRRKTIQTPNERRSPRRNTLKEVNLEANVETTQIKSPVEENTQVRTRSRRNTTQTPNERRSSRRELKEVNLEANIEITTVKSPIEELNSVKRSSRRRTVKTPVSETKILDQNEIEKIVEGTPKKSTRSRRKTVK